MGACRSGPGKSRIDVLALVGRKFSFRTCKILKLSRLEASDLLYAVEAMRKIAVCAFLFSAASFAQTADVAYFRAVMLPANEVPVVNANVSGVADLIAHVVRDSTGQITSGTVQFLVRVNFAADNTATGLHIHSGGPTVAGPVVIGTALSDNPQPIKA